MVKYKNYLRVYRKKAHLTQADIAQLMDHEDASNLSRRENGKREPSTQMLLVYHLLFDTPIEAFFKIEKMNLKQKLISRIKDLIVQLETSHSINTRQRILTLEAALTRLTSRA